ncbi:hypothetical protein HYC85_004751, partial [Camellia sinensis]
VGIQFQGSYATFPSSPVPWNKGIALKRFVTTLHMVVKTDSVAAPLIRGPKAKSLRVSAFKGNSQNDESGGRASGSKSAKNSVKISYVQHGSEETLTESPKMQDVPLSCASEADETIAGSSTIQNLFKNWLMLLRTQPPNEVMDESLEGPDSGKISVMQNGTQEKERGEILKAQSLFTWQLKWFTGAEVSKELMPLWVLGPLIVALYIKILRGLCALYVFTFKQTVKVVKNLPTYYLVAYSYIASGKLEENVRARLLQPLVDIKNLDYKELLKIKMKNLGAWASEKYLDYVESIWPYYCRTIRFLKRANLI